MLGLKTSKVCVRWVCFAVVLTVLTTACGSSGGGGSSSPTTSGASSGSTKNSASFQGVTADAIKVGVAVPDFKALQKLGVQNYWGDFKTAYQPFFDAINAAGGIHGRKVEPVYAGFNYLKPETQDAACTQLTEDDKVFIVLGGLLSDSNLCLTQLHKTMVMTATFLTDQLKQKSGNTLWLSLGAIGDAGAKAMGEALAKAGKLKGKKIGIIANGGLDNGQGKNAMHDTLGDLGYDSTVAVTSAPLDDETARNAELDSITQRFKSDGIDFVILLLGGGDPYSRFDAADYHPEIADAALVASLGGSTHPELLDNVYGVGGKSDNDIWNDPTFKTACRDVVLKAHPELANQFNAQVPTGEQQAKGEANWFEPIRWACNQAMLLKKLGEISGGNLTNDTFRAALDKLGPIDLYGYGRANFRSPDKWDGLDEFSLIQYDAAKKQTETIGDPVVMKR